MTDAPLHPRRIRAALNYLVMPEGTTESGLRAAMLPREVVETARTALHWIEQAQQKTGLTESVVDVGAKGWELLRALTRIR